MHGIIHRSEQCSIFFFEVKQCNVLCCVGAVRFAVLPFHQPDRDVFSPSFCDVKQCCGFCYVKKLRFAVVRVSKSGWERFSPFFVDVKQ